MDITVERMTPQDWETVRTIYLEGIATDHMRELTHGERKALHHLKYFTWVEQQQKSVADLDRLWEPDFWDETYAQVKEWDRWIDEFNQRVGL